jgi:hypothetical protein
MADPYSSSLAAKELLNALNDLEAFIKTHDGQPVVLAGNNLPEEAGPRASWEEMDLIGERINRFAFALGFCSDSDSFYRRDGGILWPGKFGSWKLPGDPPNYTRGMVFLSPDAKWSESMRKVREKARVAIESWRSRVIIWVSIFAGIAGIVGILIGLFLGSRH